MIVPLKLVTLVTEGLLKDKIITLLEKQGATGFTIVRAEGKGSRGLRATDWEGPNYRFEVITSQEGADKILAAVQEKYLKHYAVIVWLSDVDVLRGDKFVKNEKG
ncbi:MAG: nitrogen regulatory protein PII [Akkermansiaceae bacterium]|jgi:nitrogen regulatory protein P-II 2